ncbi:hypothetical protein FPV67DRAFT_1085413 [Lyophyllum atratum]|nr:hypothetical protein FPV67DRAFT_1085413 [Lyophyllum atratum]
MQPVVLACCTGLWGIACFMTTGLRMIAVMIVIFNIAKDFQLRQFQLYYLLAHSTSACSQVVSPCFDLNALAFIRSYPVPDESIMLLSHLTAVCTVSVSAFLGIARCIKMRSHSLCISTPCSERLPIIH